jgi:hypothetical protein
MSFGDGLELGTKGLLNQPFESAASGMQGLLEMADPSPTPEHTAGIERMNGLDVVKDIDEIKRLHTILKAEQATGSGGVGLKGTVYQR